MGDTARGWLLFLCKVKGIASYRVLAVYQTPRKAFYLSSHWAREAPPSKNIVPTILSPAQRDKATCPGSHSQQIVDVHDPTVRSFLLYPVTCCPSLLGMLFHWMAVPLDRSDHEGRKMFLCLIQLLHPQSPAPHLAHSRRSVNIY